MVSGVAPALKGAQDQFQEDVALANAQHSTRFLAERHDNR